MTFSEYVVKLTLMIPPGRVTTYGRISRAAGGGSMASQSITGILAKAYNEGIKDIPFHRIVYADGRVWVDEAHRKERMCLYKKEGIIVNKNNKIQNFDDIVFEFK